MKTARALLQTSFALLGFLALQIVGPELETRFHPVFSTFEIVNVDPHPNGTDTLMTIKGYKFRDCAPAGYGWYTSDLSNFTHQLNVVSNREQNPTVRLPVGRFFSTFTVKDIVLTAKDIPTLRGETFSKCHWLWITRSEVFP